MSEATPETIRDDIAAYSSIFEKGKADDGLTRYQHLSHVFQIAGYPAGTLAARAVMQALFFALTVRMTGRSLLRSGFASIGLATHLAVAVEPPATPPELSVAKLQAWLETNDKTPREQATKVALRRLPGIG